MYLIDGKMSMDKVIEKQLGDLINFSLEFNEKLKKIIHHFEKDTQSPFFLDQYLRQTDQEKISRISRRECQVLEVRV
jgi:hypothetical protein